MEPPSDDVIDFRRWHGAANDHAPPADTHVVTSSGRRFLAHSGVLASASPVLESIVYRPRKNRQSERVVRILGVPCDALVAFLRFLYSSGRTSSSTKEGEEAIEKYGIQLLALSHKYRVQWLKRKCEAVLTQDLRVEQVMDVVKVAKLCDASRLYEKCLRVVYKDFPAVQQSEGWRFVQKHDRRLELEILQYIQDMDQRKKKWWREKAAQDMYRQLSEAMDCLQHICTEGCTKVGPHNKEPPSKNRGPCTGFRTCEGLQLLIGHFASCSKRLSPEGGCPHCKRMWQLFRLHSSICDLDDSCKVPLCKQFKMKMQREGKGEGGTWRLLAKKVVTARVMSSLAKRKTAAQLQMPLATCKGTK